MARSAGARSMAAIRGLRLVQEHVGTREPPLSVVVQHDPRAITEGCAAIGCLLQYGKRWRLPSRFGDAGAKLSHPTRKHDRTSLGQLACACPVGTLPRDGPTRWDVKAYESLNSDGCNQLGIHHAAGIGIVPCLQVVQEGDHGSACGTSRLLRTATATAEKSKSNRGRSRAEKERSTPMPPPVPRGHRARHQPIPR